MSATVYSSDRTGLLIIDPYNDFANGGIDRERWRKLKPGALEAAARDLSDEDEGVTRMPRPAHRLAKRPPRPSKSAVLLSVRAVKRRRSCRRARQPCRVRAGGPASVA